MSPTVDPSSTLICAKCGVAQPLMMFDQRFIGKGRKLTCATCRGVANEATKWQDIWAKQRISDERMAELTRYAAEERAREQAREQMREKEQRRRARIERVRSELRDRGFSDGEIGVIWNIHVEMRAAKLSWSEIRRRFSALTPPYVPDAPRRRASDALREAIYQEQQGRCFYCGLALLPLSAWKRGSREGVSLIDQIRSDARMTGKYTATLDIPELDHKVPASRGGDLTRENLCYACSSCNQAKESRTASEFALYPNDPISELKLTLRLIYLGAQVEAHGYDQFDALSLYASRRRFPAL